MPRPARRRARWSRPLAIQWFASEKCSSVSVTPARSSSRASERAPHRGARDQRPRQWPPRLHLSTSRPRRTRWHRRHRRDTPRPRDIRIALAPPDTESKQVQPRIKIRNLARAARATVVPRRVGDELTMTDSVPREPRSKTNSIGRAASHYAPVAVVSAAALVLPLNVPLFDANRHPPRSKHLRRGRQGALLSGNYPPQGPAGGGQPRRRPRGRTTAKRAAPGSRESRRRPRRPHRTTRRPPPNRPGHDTDHAIRSWCPNRTAFGERGRSGPAG